MAEKILVVEDELALRETLAYNLKKEGYTVEAVSDGRAAVDAARRFLPDLIILDVMLPELDGFEVARQIRAQMAAAILMVTAKVDEVDRVVGLEVGADDYVTKPFSMRELLARVKAQLRRARLLRQENRGPDDEEAPSNIQLDTLLIDANRREARLAGQPLQLKPKEYELLMFFARHKGRTLSRELILRRVWGWDFIGDSRTVDVHVRWLRQKIEADPSKPERLVTVRGGGYRLER
jgi:DNA-binding response OmpR family regulator